MYVWESQPPFPETSVLSGDFPKQAFLSSRYCSLSLYVEPEVC